MQINHLSASRFGFLQKKLEVGKKEWHISNPNDCFRKLHQHEKLDKKEKIGKDAGTIIQMKSSKNT